MQFADISYEKILQQGDGNTPQMPLTVKLSSLNSNERKQFTLRSVKYYTDLLRKHARFHQQFDVQMQHLKKWSF